MCVLIGGQCSVGGATAPVFALDNYFPKPLSAAEWVGVAVLLLGVAAVLSIVRGSKRAAQARAARISGVSALTLMAVGVWIGIGAQIEIVGALILACGCTLALWSLLLNMGFTWRGHVRPAILPIALAACAVGFCFYAPRSTVAALVLAFSWGWRRRHRTQLQVDRELHYILRRALAVTHAETGAYIVQLWFGRFAEGATDLWLLCVAKRTRDMSALLPQSRSIASVTRPVLVLDKYASEALEDRLHTDNAAARYSSWIRVLAGEFVRRLWRATGIQPLLRFFGSLLLAVPPPDGQVRRADGQQNRTPDPALYVTDLLAALLPVPETGDLERISDQVEREAETAGTEWLRAVAAQAEQLREQLPRVHKDHRIEMLSEALWGLHEAILGSRPEKYDVLDQLRLQVPDLVDGLSIQQLDVQHETGRLSVSLHGLPARFDELTPSTNGTGGQPRLLLETRDRRQWRFERLEAAAGQEVQMQFIRSG